MQKIYTILNEEHKKIKEAFEELIKNPTKKDWNIIVNSLSMHLEIEEKELYSELSEFEELKDEIIQFNDEHNHIKMILKNLERMDISDEDFMPRLKVLKEMVEHHIKEEEIMFSKAKSIKHNGIFSFLHSKN